MNTAALAAFKVALREETITALREGVPALEVMLALQDAAAQAAMPIAPDRFEPIAPPPEAA